MSLALTVGKALELFSRGGINGQRAVRNALESEQLVSHLAAISERTLEKKLQRLKEKHALIRKTSYGDNTKGKELDDFLASSFLDVLASTVPEIARQTPEPVADKVEPKTEGL